MPIVRSCTEASGRLLAGLLVSAALGAAAGCQPTGPSADWELAVQGIYAGALSGDAELSLIGSLNHGGSLWRNADHARLYSWNHRADGYSELVAAAFSQDGTRAVTTDPRTLVVWDTTTGAALSFWTTPAPVLDVALVPGGNQVLMGMEDHSAVVFDASTGSYGLTLLHEGVVGAVAVSFDGALALTGSDDETAALWDLASGERLQTFQASNPVRVIALSASGRLAFTASQGREVALWDSGSGLLLHELARHNQGVTSAEFSADERSLLVGYVNRTIELWDVERGALLDRWNASARNPWHPTGSAILAVAFGTRPDAFYALSGDGRLVELRRS